MSEAPVNPYTPPTVSDPMPELPVTGAQLATRGQRFGGAVIDGLINLVVVFGLYFLLFQQNIFAPKGGQQWWQTAVLSVLGLGIFIGINFKFLRDQGQTIGKKAVGTRIVTMDDRNPSLGDLIVKRYGAFTLAGLIPVIGGFIGLANSLAIFGRDKRCLHDYLAGTKVVVCTPEVTPVTPPVAGA
ncbi:RDD family protein [Luteolibacter marinus]|uniref:RDD family protein n=1 Tax=Luteolibacter marinus TaxID=2776705 RepID=UPI0018666EF3|nr:RDD family protein [Luteolibacter marinus]